jgi:hypothetical protein
MVEINYTPMRTVATKVALGNYVASWQVAAEQEELI